MTLRALWLEHPALPCAQSGGSTHSPPRPGDRPPVPRARPPVTSDLDAACPSSVSRGLTDLRGSEPLAGLIAPPGSWPGSLPLCSRGPLLGRGLHSGVENAFRLNVRDFQDTPNTGRWALLCRPGWEVRPLAPGACLPPLWLQACPAQSPEAPPRVPQGTHAHLPRAVPGAPALDTWRPGDRRAVQPEPSIAEADCHL